MCLSKSQYCFIPFKSAARILEEFMIIDHCYIPDLFSDIIGKLVLGNADVESEDCWSVCESCGKKCVAGCNNVRITGFANQVIPIWTDTVFKQHFRMERSTFKVRTITLSDIYNLFQMQEPSTCALCNQRDFVQQSRRHLELDST